MGNLHFTATIDAASFNKTLNDIEKRIKGLSDKGKSETGFLQTAMDKLGGAITDTFSMGNLKEFVSNIIKVRGEIQQLENSFAGLLQNKANANVLMSDIVSFAAQSPFQLSEIAESARQLLSYGSASQSVVKEIRMLGEVASGTLMPLNDLIELYGSLKNAGKVSSSDLESFAAKGIPIYNELGKVLNVGVNRVKELAQAGRIGTKDVQQAFINMTSAGGMFQGMLSKQTQTLTGLIDGFDKAINNMFNDIGKSQEGVLSAGISGATFLAEHYETVAKILFIIIEAYGAYKAVLITTNLLQKGVEAGKTGIAALTAGINAASGAQSAFNAIAKANPYFIAGSIILILATSFVLFSEKVDAATEAQKRFNDEQARTNQQKDETIGKTQALINTIRNETASRFQQVEAFRELQALYPSLFSSMTLETFKKKEAATVQKELNKALDEMSMASVEKQLKTAIENVEELEKKIKNTSSLPTGPGVMPINEIKNYNELAIAKKLVEEYTDKLKNLKEVAVEANTPAKEQIAHYEKIRDTLEKNIEHIRGTASPLRQAGREANAMKRIFEQIRLTMLLQDLDETNKKLDKARDKFRSEKDSQFSENLGNVKTTKDLRGLITEATTNDRKGALVGKTKSLLDSTEKSDPEFKKLQKLYNELTAQKKDIAPFGSLKYWEEILKKAKDALALVTRPESDKTKELLKTRLDAEFKVAELRLQLDKNYADGSIESYERIARSARELITKSSPGAANYTALLETETKAKENAELLRKSLAIRNTEQEIEEKKTQYELYTRWVKYAGKEAADNQFKDLKKSGDSFKNYLQANIDAIDGKVNAGSATQLDLENLVKYKTAFDLINESIDDYKKKITSAGEKSGSLTAYLRQLKEELAKLGANDGSKKTFLTEQIIETEKKRKALLDEFLVEFNLNEQKRLEIQKKYNDIRTQLDTQYADKKSDAYQSALTRINDQEKEALQKYDVAAVLKNSKGYQELQKIIIGTEESVLKSRIENTKKVLDELSEKGLRNTEEYKKQLQSLIDLQEKLVNSQISYFTRIGNILGKFNKNSKGVIGIIGSLGEGLSGLANSTGNLMKLGKIIGETDQAKKNAGSIEERIAAGAIGAKKVQEAKAMMLADIAVQAINDIAATLKSKKDKEKSYYDLVISQQINYNKLLNDEIRLKSQTESFFTADNNTVIEDSLKARADAFKNYNDSLKKLTDSGKAKDGTETGINLSKALTTFLYNPVKAVFGTTETRDVLTPILEKYPDLYNKAIGGVKGFNKELAQSLIASNAVDEATKQQLQTTLDWVNQYELAQKQLQESIISMTGQIGEDLKNALVSAFREGKSAAEAFGATVEKVIENIIIQALYTQMLKPVIDRLGKEIGESYAEDENGNLIGDGSILDDMERFNDYGLKSAEEYFTGVEQAQKVFKEKGFNIFQPDSSDGGKGLSGSIKSITEETAGVLEGQMNAIRITQATNLEVNRNQLLALTQIANNSEYLKHLELLKSIDKKLSTSNELRAAGIE